MCILIVTVTVRNRSQFFNLKKTPLLRNKMRRTSTTLIVLGVLVLLVSSTLASDVIEVTSRNFNEVVLKSPVPVLVEFYAPYVNSIA